MKLIFKITSLPSWFRLPNFTPKIPPFARKRGQSQGSRAGSRAGAMAQQSMSIHGYSPQRSTTGSAAVPVCRKTAAAPRCVAWSNVCANAFATGTGNDRQGLQRCGAKSEAVAKNGFRLRANRLGFWRGGSGGTKQRPQRILGADIRQAGVGVFGQGKHDSFEQLRQQLNLLSGEDTLVEHE